MAPTKFSRMSVFLYSCRVRRRSGCWGVRRRRRWHALPGDDSAGRWRAVGTGGTNGSDPAGNGPGSRGLPGGGAGGSPGYSGVPSGAYIAAP